MAEADPAVAMRRIKGLLAKAEGTDVPEEAESFFAKAAELMDKYRIDAEQVRAARGEAEEPIEGTYYPLAERAKYLRPSLHLLAAVALHYSVKPIVGATGNSKAPLLAGTATDIEATIMMFESLLAQRDRECLNTVPPAYSNTNQFRSGFGYGYAERIFLRLDELRKVTAAHAEREGYGNALAVIDHRMARVNAYLVGKTKRNDQKGARVDAAGAQAGDEAASRADLGQSRMGSGPLAIGAG